MDKFIDRRQAGQLLAIQLNDYVHRPNALVLALPRGGVPVAYEIAKSLGLPLDILIVRKLGVPGHEELAMGAISSEDTLILNKDIVKQLHVAPEKIQTVMQTEQQELIRREKAYRGKRPAPSCIGKTIILVDDGIATGATMRAAIHVVRRKGAALIIVAVPVASLDTCEEIAPLVDKLICLLKPHDFYAVGAWYEHFPQTTDEEVSELLKK